MYVEKSNMRDTYMKGFEGDGQMFITYYFTDSKLHVKALM